MFPADGISLFKKIEGSPLLGLAALEPCHYWVFGCYPNEGYNTMIFWLIERAPPLPLAVGTLCSIEIVFTNYIR